MMINEYLENKCAQTEEIIGVTLTASEKEEMKKELITSFTLLARECNVDVNIILNDIDLIAELDELIPYNDESAAERLLAAI